MGASGEGAGGHTIQDEGSDLTKRKKLNFVGAGVAVTDDSGNDASKVSISGGGGGGHTIRDEGVDLTDRTGLNFIGAHVVASDDAVGDETEVNVSSEINTSSNVGGGEGIAKTKVVEDLPFKSLLGTANEITLVGNTNDVTFSLNSLIARLNVAQKFTEKQQFQSSEFAIRNPADTFEYLFIGSAIVADRNITLPLLTGNITLGDRATSLIIPASDETTVLTTGTAKVTFRMPFAFTLTEVRASLSTAGTGAALVTVDINEGGTTILSTKITIDASEKTSETAATAPVISDTALADDAEITIDIDTIDTDNLAKGLKVYLIGYKTP